MTALLLLPPILSFLMLGAHLFRAGHYGATSAMLALAALLAARRRFVVRATQVALVLGSVTWLHTLFLIREARLIEGRPVQRLTVVLLSVAAFTLLSGLVFFSSRLRSRYGCDSGATPTA